MLKVGALIAFAASATAFFDDFEIFSRFEFHDVADELCVDCIIDLTIEGNPTRSIWGATPDLSCSMESVSSTSVNTGLNVLEWTPLSNCNSKFEVMYTFGGYDLTTDGDDTLAVDFGTIGWNFFFSDLCFVACESPCPAPGTFSGGNTEGITMTNFALPADCARHCNIAIAPVPPPDIIAEYEQAYMNWDNYENVDFTNIGCLLVGTFNVADGNTMNVGFIETRDNITPSASVTGDPHLVGFHGERAEIMDKEPAFYSIYCDETTMVNIRTEPSPVGAAYIAEIFFSINGETSSYSVEAVKNMARQKISVETGNVNFDIRYSADSVVSFLDVSLSAHEARKAGGILGRTLEREFSAAEFQAISSYSVAPEAHSGSHVCL